MVDRWIDRWMDRIGASADRPAGRPAGSARSRIRIVPPISDSQRSARGAARRRAGISQSAALHPFSSHPPSQAPAGRPARRRLPAGRAPRRPNRTLRRELELARPLSITPFWLALRFASAGGAFAFVGDVRARACTTCLARVSRSPSLPVARWGGGGTAGRPPTGAADSGRAHTLRARRAAGSPRAGGAGAAAARRRPARAEAVTCESSSNFTRASARAPRRATTDAPLRSTPVAAAHGPAAALQPSALSREWPGDGEQTGADSAAEVARGLTASLGKN